MPLRALSRITLLGLLGCSQADSPAAGNPPLQTDGSAESAIVVRWLAGEEGLAVAGAQLIVSDFGVPLTVTALREFGPDGDGTCRRTRVTRLPYRTRLAWSCRRSWGDCPRHVDFTLEAGRIRFANTDEGMVALDRDGRELASPIPCSPASTSPHSASGA